MYKNKCQSMLQSPALFLLLCLAHFSPDNQNQNQNQNDHGDDDDDD